MAKHRVTDVDDESTHEPMHGYTPSTRRRAPSSDQKRIRRQMAKSQEQSMQNATPKTAAEQSDTSISPRQREIDFLQAMAAAGSIETQAKLAAELENFRAERIRASRRHDTLEFDGPVPESRWEHNANPATIRTSMASDWLMDVPEPNHTALERDQKMVAEASLWFTRTPQSVRDDHDEFAVQAFGMARYAASQFGDDATNAQATFLDHVSRLAGRKVAVDMLVTPTNDTVTAPPVQTEPMDTVQAPADTGPAEVDHSGPSDNASLSEGNPPAGDTGGDPVSDSAAANNAGDSGDTAPAVDNRPANPTVLPESGVAKSQASIGAKRKAVMDRLAASPVCRACGEQIEKAPNGGWRHAGYQHQKGHQRNHIAAPAATTANAARHLANTPDIAGSPFSGEANAEEVAANSPGGGAGQTRQYKVKFDHPSGASHTQTVSVPSGHGPEHAIQQVRNQFKNHDQTALGNWRVDLVTSPWSGQANDESIRNNSSKRTAAVPEPDGLNAGVDFDPNADPNDSMSLGTGDEGEWPAGPDGDPQTMTNPTTSTAALYDMATDRRIAAATEDHELAATASVDGSIYVDGDLMVISAAIAGEDYVTGPVRHAYLGAEEEAPSTSDDFSDYGNPAGGNTGGYEQPPPGVNPHQVAPGAFDADNADVAQERAAHPDWYGDTNQGPEYEGLLGETPSTL